MHRRPLLAGGLASIVVGALLIFLGLGRGSEDAPEVTSRVVPSASVTPSRSAQGATPSPTLAPATPTVTVAPSRATPTPSPTRSVRKPAPGTSPPASAQPKSSGLRLGVAAIGLDTSLRSGGVGSSGTINPPAGKAMWVRGYGRVQPGKVGTAVVAGHVVSSGDADVFAELSSVQVGHKVVITSGSVTRTYVVRRAEVVTKSALTRDADVWGQNSSRRRVVLITCDDELGYRSDGHRVANYVVVADAV